MLRIRSATVLSVSWGVSRSSSVSPEGVLVETKLLTKTKKALARYLVVSTGSRSVLIRVSKRPPFFCIRTIKTRCLAVRAFGSTAVPKATDASSSNAPNVLPFGQTALGRSVSYLNARPAVRANARSLDRLTDDAGASEYMRNDNPYRRRARPAEGED